MKQKSGMIGVVYAAILSAIAGYFFRMTQLSGGSSVPLIAFSILMVFVFALAAVSLEKKSAYAQPVRWADFPLGGRFSVPFPAAAFCNSPVP